MALLFSNLFLTSAVSDEVWRHSVEASVGSFFWAGILIVAPAAFFLIWISQKDALDRSR